MTDFAHYPKTLGEKRSDDDGGNAAKWGVRDALIAVLRLIDSGKESPDAIVITYRETTGVGTTRSHFAVASPDIHTTLGLLETAKLQMWNQG